MDELFSSGMLVGQSNYTFSNVPSGGLYILNYDYNASLVSGMTASTPSSPVENRNIYISNGFVNRVVAMISTRNGGWFIRNRFILTIN